MNVESLLLFSNTVTVVTVWVLYVIGASNQQRVENILYSVLEQLEQLKGSRSKVGGQYV